MTGGAALARRGSICTKRGPVDWFPQMEFYYNFTTKSADSNLNGNTSDSGHTVSSNPGADTEAIGQIVSSSLDSTLVYTVLDTQSDGSNSHLLTPDLGANIVFMRARIRFNTNTGTTDAPALAMIPWSNWPENNSTTTTAAHTLFRAYNTEAQTYTGLAATTQWTNTYAAAFTTQWQDCLIAIDQDAGAVVIGLPDGDTRAYTTTLASTLTDVTIGDFEISHPTPNSDARVEMSHVGCATLAGMTTDVAAAYDELLVTQGYGSAYTPVVEFSAAANVDSATADPTPASASGSCVGGISPDFAVLVIEVIAQTSAGAISGHTRTATYDGVSMTSIAAQYVNAETDAPGYWLEVFTLANPAAGTKTCTVDVSKSGEDYRVRGTVFTVRNVSSIDTPVVAYGTGTGAAMGVTVTSETGDVVVVAGLAESTGNVGGFDGTAIRDGAYDSTSYAAPPFLVERVTGSASVTDTFTRPVAAADWVCIGFNLNKSA